VLLDQVHNEIRTKRYSICNEQEQKELKKKFWRFRRQKNKGEKGIFQYNSNDALRERD